MTTIVLVEDSKALNSQEYKVLTKGAPEIIKQLLKEVPNGYDKSY